MELPGIPCLIPVLAVHVQPFALIECAAVAAVLAILLSFPKVRKIIRAPAEPSDPASHIRPMRPRGIFAAYLLITLIVGGSLLDLFRDKEHWPWSNFPMYSQVTEMGPTFEDYRLSGVLQDGTEISLSSDGRYLQPFDPSRLAEALTVLVSDAQSNDPRLDEGLLDCLQRYEILRKTGAHDGPPLIALRMYRVRFTLDPYARNTDQPDQKILIHEVTLLTRKPL